MFNIEIAKAHCDVPCGIYDPISAQIAALSVIRMVDLMESLEKSDSLEYINTISRHVAVKESEAEKVKHEIRIIWGDFIKPPMVEKYPNIHVKALTAAEIHFLAEQYNKTYEEIIDMMLLNGVDSMPGGGAEIFDEGVRKRVCGGKVSSQQWLDIHKMWHEKGKQSNATMLFGHIESRAHRIDHMIRLRDLQDQTGGFNAFIPLVYQKENNFLKVKDFLTGQEILKTMAISRIMLDNIPHLKAYWVTSTVKLALVSQEFGANDLDGTIEKESINSAAGAQSANGMPLQQFVDLIKNSGFTPVERDSVYNEIKTW